MSKQEIIQEFDERITELSKVLEALRIAKVYFENYMK